MAVITKEAVREIVELNEIVIRLRNEIIATEGLIREGDPFTMTRQDYLNNLKYLLQEKPISDGVKTNG